MARHKKNLWAVLAESLAPTQAPRTQARTAPPAPPREPSPDTRAIAAQAWAKDALQALAVAHDAESFQTAASMVYTMIHYESTSGYPMTPYLPNLVLNLVNIGGELGDRVPEAQERIEWCVNEVLALLATEYNPPGGVDAEMREALRQLSTGERTPTSAAVPDGAVLLEEVADFLARYVVYPSEHARVAHTLWIAHAWFMTHWESTPRLAFLSTEPGSGKSRCLEVTEPLVPNAIHAVNVTPTYIFRKISDEAGLPTILFDEVDTVFNAKGGGNETLRGVLNAGYRRGATAGRCSASGIEELPAYCAVALAGLGNLPDTIMTRAVVIRLRKRPANAVVSAWRPREVSPVSDRLRDALQGWSEAVQGNLEWPVMPEGIADRNADVWEPLLAVANLAGGSWPERAREAALYLIQERNR